jgi:thiol-disulfide isomerase/thioredoxin
MTRHPSTILLSRHADGELSPRRALRVSRHVAACARCRRAVAELRDVGELASALNGVAPPEGALDRILARRAAGGRVMLPGKPRPAVVRRRTGRVVRLAAAACVVLLAGAAAMLLRTRELEADHSELRFSPAQPRAGQTVHVEYRATGRFAGQSRLVLRARFVDERSGENLPTVRVAELSRDEGGTFRGTFRLPDTAGYAVFAVEDTAARSVDYNAERWELLAHGRDGRPLRAALAARVNDVRQRDREAARATAGLLARLYPDHPGSWLAVFDAEHAAADAERTEALKAEHRLRFASLAAALSRPGASEGDLCDMAFYASRVGDSAVYARWTGRLYRDYPASACSVKLRALDEGPVAEETAATRVAAYEQMWQRYGAVTPQLPFSAFMAARGARDPAAMLTWGSRLSAAVPWIRPMVGQVLLASADPAAHAAGMESIRALLSHMDSLPDAERTLTMTREEQRRVSRRGAAALLRMLGTALAADGRRAAALDTLQRAQDATWDPALFRELAALRLSVGDTAGAFAALAGVAADPLTPPAFADSARARLGGGFDAARWQRSLAEGRERMRSLLASAAQSRAVRLPVRVSNATGQRTGWRPDGGRPTVVAFWLRHCPPSREQLDGLPGLQAALAARGASFVTITPEAPSANLSAFVSGMGFRFPVLYDVDGDAARAFGGVGTPTYVVLDAAGRIRFADHTPADVVREVAFLQDAGR